MSEVKLILQIAEFGCEYHCMQYVQDVYCKKLSAAAKFLVLLCILKNEKLSNLVFKDILLMF